MTKWTAVLYDSKEQTWATPQALFDKLDEEFNFELDAAASELNAKCEVYLTEEQNALDLDWSKYASRSVWLNPPYGRAIGKWIRKAYMESTKGLCVVCLVFARTDTRWFHRWAMKAQEIRFIPGRITFGNAANSAPAPSCVLIFDPSRAQPRFTVQELPRK
tara:strand:+ start:2148 stop:2630 length:483 start_codon:yes stop_codon:yes gene_type:complete